MWVAVAAQWPRCAAGNRYMKPMLVEPRRHAQGIKPKHGSRSHRAARSVRTGAG